LKLQNAVPLLPTSVFAATNPQRFQLTFPPGFSISASLRNSRLFSGLSFQLSSRTLISFHESGFSARFSTADGAHHLYIFPSAVRIATRVPASVYRSSFDAVIGSDPSLVARFGDADSIGCLVSFRGGRPSRCSIFTVLSDRRNNIGSEICYNPAGFVPFSMVISTGRMSDRAKFGFTVAVESLAELRPVMRWQVGGRLRWKWTIVSGLMSVAISKIDPFAIDWRVGWHSLVSKGTKLFIGKLQDGVVVSVKKKFVSGMIVKPSLAIGKHIGLKLLVIHPSAGG
jgi:hypothetical protein